VRLVAAPSGFSEQICAGPSRTGWARVRRPLLVVLSVSAFVLGSASAGFASIHLRVGARHLVGSTFTTTSGPVLSCPPGKPVASTTCYLVGAAPGGTAPKGVTPYPPDDYLNEVVPVRDGNPGTPVTFPGLESASLISCASATACETAGYSTTYSKASFIPVTKGKPGRPITVGSGFINWTGLVCSSPGNCLGVGSWRKTANSATERGVVVGLHNGKASKEQLLADSSGVEGVSCLSTTSCVAVGQTADQKFGFVIPIHNGHVGAIHVVTSAGAISSVACDWTKNTCVGLGYTPVTKIGVYPARVLIRGTRVRKLPTSTPAASFTCASLGHCVAFGVADPNSRGEHAVVAVVTNGKIGRWVTVGGSGDVGWVACSRTGSCDGVASSLTGQYPGYTMRTFTLAF
jgi:hypothetical protein